jgi:hypothetical protein
MSIIRKYREIKHFLYEILDSDPGSAPHYQYEAVCPSVIYYLFFSFLPCINQSPESDITHTFD